MLNPIWRKRAMEAIAAIVPVDRSTLPARLDGESDVDYARRMQRLDSESDDAYLARIGMADSAVGFDDILRGNLSIAAMHGLLTGIPFPTSPRLMTRRQWESWLDTCVESADRVTGLVYADVVAQVESREAEFTAAVSATKNG